MNKTLFASLFLISSFLSVDAFAKEGVDTIPLEHFSCRSNRSSFKISPDGKHMLIANMIKDNECDIEQNYDRPEEEEMGNVGLILINLDTQESKSISRGVGSDRINNTGSFGWLNNNRIWYVPFIPQGKKGAAAFAVNLDGSRRTTLWKYGAGEGFTSPYEMDYSDPNHIYVTNNKRRAGVSDYYKLNVYTGASKRIATGPDLSRLNGGVSLLGRLNHSDGQPLGMVLDNGLKRIILEYKQDSQEWEEHFTFNCQEPGFIPIGIYKGKMVVAGSKFAPDGSLVENNDTNGIYLYDYKNREFGNLLFKDPEFDAAGLTGGCRPAQGNVFTDVMSNEADGIGYWGMGYERVFFDKEYEANYMAVKGVFPDHNLSVTTTSADRTRMVVQIWDTDEPGEYFYVDLNKGEVISLFKSKPWLDRSKLSKGQKIWYTARDGLKIPAVFTPTKMKTDRNYFVILPHGGPNTRQWIGFDGWAQFFASRGINVLQPDFRGSTGLGYSHYMLGNKQWGKTMQDDLSDGVKWAIDNGYADADRVCIAGASYGGYATMAGMTFTPELYRCGINGVGVTDQMLILENFAQKRSRNQSWDKEPLLEWGDLYNEEDYAYAKASSPVNFVKDIEGAVLVLHGSNDRVVEPRHAEDLIAQLKKYDIEYMDMFQAKAGHCIDTCGERASLEYMGIQEEFLDKYLKN